MKLTQEIKIVISVNANIITSSNSKVSLLESEIFKNTFNIKRGLQQDHVASCKLFSALDSSSKVALSEKQTNKTYLKTFHVRIYTAIHRRQIVVFLVLIPSTKTVY